MQRFILAALPLALGGCATPVATEALKPPPSRCMAAPGEIPSVSAGDDMKKVYAALRRRHAAEISKVRCLQAYVRAVRGHS
jgi:hypothetical protein